MPRVKLNSDRSVLIIVDIQPVLSKTIFEAEAVLGRIAFIARIASLLEIPVLTTEQNPTRMGATHPTVAPYIDPNTVFGKMGFSAVSSTELVEALHLTRRDQIVVVGMETHICVSQTCQDLQDLGFEVVVCPDAVSARSLDRHKLGMERLRDAGVVPAHTESVAYEWLKAADHPLFKVALSIVKEHP